MRILTDELPRYERSETYDWNFEHAPQEIPKLQIPAFPGSWTYCGLPVNSPLGIAAGPLLNGNWCRYYAALGFDVLTYKTVRTRDRACYPLPNLAPVTAETLTGGEDSVSVSNDWSGSWAVSFGMPSKMPSFWIGDINKTKACLKPGQLLSVSVVGTMQSDWTLEELAKDYADAASWAFDATADCVEMNFSCPNVCSEDGQLFQNPVAAALVAEVVRDRVGFEAPLLTKIGYLADHAVLEELISRLAPFVNAIVTTNSLPAKVKAATGEYLFESQQRGICGKATLNASVDQVRRIHRIIDKDRLPLEVIGVGGIECAADVRRYLDAGASSVQLATAAMIDPLVGVKIREEFASA